MNVISLLITISIENVPEKYLDMTYDSEPRTI